jgi:acyl-CoA synthetase (AMP-forming)/AMP-acid ligase II
MSTPSHFDAPEPLLPDLLDGHATWQSDRPALICGGTSLTWGEFGTTVRRTAAALVASGIAHGDRVAVLMANSVEMVEVLFGTMRAGACVVPLNTSVADAAIEAMVNDCGATALLVSAEHLPRVMAMRLPDVRLRVVAGSMAPTLPQSWLGYADWRATADPDAPLPRLAAGDLANIIYSSGTTGVPKGIVHDHGRRASWARSLALVLRYHSRAVALCPIGLYSNISWVTMLCTVVVGGCIVVEPGFEIEAMLAAIRRHGVTHSSLVPVIVQRLLESGRLPTAVPGSLRALMCCGSPLPIELKKRALREFGCDFIELYGLTEGVITTLDPEDAAGREASVGRPLPGTLLRIIDDAGRELPVGEAGEIVSRGHITMTGYYNRPQASAESTWIDAADQRWLRTGDVGRVDAEGFLYIVDRKKDMIISGGQNIYPTDIETVILGHPVVSEVAVIGIPSDRWGETPFAVVVPRQAPAEPEILAHELRDWVNQRVGKQQRVAGLRFVDRLPRNPNGKILKRELRREYSKVAG